MSIFGNFVYIIGRENLYPFRRNKMKSIIQAGKNQLLAKVNRDDFLRATFPKIYKNNCDKILAPEELGVSQKDLYDKAREIIRNHTLKTTISSATLAIPGGTLMFASIPADLYQYCHQLLIVGQKLSYLYGMPDLDKTNDSVQFNVLCGMLMIMLGHKINAASKPLIHLAIKEAGKKIIANQGSKSAFYRAITFVLKNMGIKQLSNKGIMKTMGKIIPFISSVVSGTITFSSFYPACNRLHRCLEKEAFGNCSC